MGARGPTPTPPHIQEARGRTNHHAAKPAPPKLEPATGECPEYLQGNARWLWDQLAPPLVKAGLLSVVGVHQLAALCSAFSTWRQYEGLCEEHGPQFAVSSGYRNAADRARADFTKLSARFGLDPASVGNVRARPPADVVANDKRDRFFGVPGGKK
jgi:P27 family predicted phage terminase small subunit